MARSWPTRIARAWRGLPRERRLAALAACALVLTLFLPWYQETVVARSLRTGTATLGTATLSGWSAFSWVEAAVLVVAAGVLTLLFNRAEGRAFHVPGGDGGTITAAGGWTCALIVWRMFDKQGVSSHTLYATTSGIDWGIFGALIAAATLTYAGTRIRAAHSPEPPLPDERPPMRTGEPPQPRPAPARRSGASEPRTPLGRLFAERPVWTGDPVGPFEPPVGPFEPPSHPPRAQQSGSGEERPGRATGGDEQLTLPLRDERR